LFSVRSVTFAYPGQDKLFQNLSLEIKPDENILLRGENGSGKSTLLRLLLGLVKPVSGSIELTGKDPGKQCAEQFRNINFNQQSTRENLFGLTPRHDLEVWQMAYPERFQDRDSMEIDPILNAKLDFPYSRLSTGELQAISLLWLPLFADLFWILDEPTVGLDSSRKEDFVTLCAEKRTTNSGMLIVSHDQALPESLFERVLLLENGSLREVK